MSGLDSHKASLRDRHEELENQIAAENRRPFPDEIKLTELKRRKLMIKDELTTE